jgi:integrase
MFVKFGRRVVYDPTDLDRWISAHRRASSPKHATAELGAVPAQDVMKSKWLDVET